MPNGHTFTHTEAIAATHAASVYKIQVRAINSNTAVDSFGAANYQRQLLIEDIGT